MATATKKRKEEANPWKAGTSSGHTTNLKQSILRLSISMANSNSPAVVKVQYPKTPKENILQLLLTNKNYCASKTKKVALFHLIKKIANITNLAYFGTVQVELE